MENTSQVILTTENAANVATIISVTNPEWGSKRFNYKGQPLNDGEYAHTWGTGSNSAVLFENEFRFWAVNTWKDGTTPANNPTGTPPILAHLTQSAIWAHNWTSFDPERRGKQFIEGYSAELSADLETLAGYGATGEQIARYRAGYEKMLRAWIGAKSNCASSAITGGSNFNVRRAEKMNGREENHGKAFFAWRDKVLNAWRREADRRKHSATVEAAGGEAGLMRQKLEKAKADHERMKAINAAVRKSDGKPETLAGLMGISIAHAHELLKPDFCGRIGVPSYELTNNLANIKRMEQRVKELEAKEARAEAAPQREAVTGNGWQLIENNEMDRYQFIFDSKPDEATRNLLKSHGFKWAPSQNAWQRQITGNASHATRQLIKQPPA